MKQIVCILAFVFFCFPAFASEKSERIVEVLKAREQIKNQIDSCLNASKTILTDKFFQDNPEAFQGLTPQSKEWPEVVKLYDEFMNVSCYMITPDEYVSILSKGLDNTLSNDEMDDALEFFMSPSGQKFVQSSFYNSKVLADFAYSDQISEKMKAAKLKYFDGLAKLAKDAGLVNEQVQP